jgi:hypothetical protein
MTSFSECRRAARLVHEAEHGREVINTIRPRGSTGLVRARGPLSLLLYRAVREDRLLGWSASDFAVLEPPGRLQGPRWLRLVDRSWETLVFGLPPGLLVVCGGVVGFMFRSSPPARLVALSLLLLAMAHVVVMMTALGIRGAMWLYRLLVIAEPRELSKEGISQLRTNHCVVALCHFAAVPLVRSLPDAVRTRVSAWNQVFAPERQIRGVIFAERGVTTTAAREELCTVSGLRRLAPALPYLVLPPSEFVRMAEPDARAAYGARGIPILVLALAVLIGTSAGEVAKWEREACRGEECQGRPVTYGDALYWLLNRLSGGDPEGLGVATFEARMVGVLTTLTSLVIVGWVIASLLQQSVTRTRNLGRELAESFNASVAESAESAASTVTDTAKGSASSASAQVTRPVPISVIFAAGLAAGLLVSQALRRSRVPRN